MTVPGWFPETSSHPLLDTASSCSVVYDNPVTLCRLQIPFSFPLLVHTSVTPTSFRLALIDNVSRQKSRFETRLPDTFSF